MVRVLVAEVAFVTNVLVVALSGRCYTLAELLGFALVMVTARKVVRHVEGCSDSGAAVIVVLAEADAE
jgi:hypothetical protein